jgi:hypothetical protein
MRRAAILLLCAQLAFPWGPRAHSVVNRAALQTLPRDGPVFLQAHEDWVAHWGVVPDSWRGIGDPSSKILEDPNHGWFQEQFAFLKPIPRSRYEFVLALYEEHKKLASKDPERAKLTNVRWTGTLPYAAMESFEHVRVAMRRYRMLQKQDPPNAAQLKMTELEMASYLGRLGHYIADAAMPLHVSIHHDGWVGENPNEYTRDPRVHGRFESQFVELIDLKETDFRENIAAAKQRDDPWAAIMDHIAMSFSHVEDVYKLDKAGAYADKNHPEARKLVYTLMTASSQLLRDLAHTAWIQSAATPVMSRQSFDPSGNPISPAHPKYNPATGSAPPQM